MKVIYPNQQIGNKPIVIQNDIVKLIKISNVDGEKVL